jgi:DNA-binding response OmpR family regulator
VRLPVVVVSAWADDEHRREAEEEGADAFVAKPFDPVELERIVAAMVERGRGGARVG